MQELLHDEVPLDGLGSDSTQVNHCYLRHFVVRLQLLPKSISLLIQVSSHDDHIRGPRKYYALRHSSPRMSVGPQ